MSDRATLGQIREIIADLPDDLVLFVSVGTDKDALPLRVAGMRRTEVVNMNNEGTEAMEALVFFSVDSVEKRD